MSHLSIEELLDLAEGARAEDTAPHLKSCAGCRDQLSELRAAMEAVSPERYGMPEPSPLFWEHFSARVHEAIAAEQPAQSAGWVPWTRQWMSWKVAVPVAGGIALVLVLATTLTFRPGPAPAPAVETAAVSSPSDAIENDVPIDDPSWALVTDLAAGMDWDSVVEAGIAAPAGSVDRALFDLSADERRELQRLLKEELERPAPSGV